MRNKTVSACAVALILVAFTAPLLWRLWGWAEMQPVGFLVLPLYGASVGQLSVEFIDWLSAKRDEKKDDEWRKDAL